MKRLSVLFAVILSSVLFTQCKRTKDASAAASAEVPQKESAVKSECQPVKVEKTYEWTGTTDPFTIEGIRISADTLLVDVRYGGGCEEHEFKMTTTGAYMKSLPVQMNLYLEHKSNNDMCRAMMFKTLKFNVSGIRYTGGEEMKLIINDDREKMVTYGY